MRICHVSMFNQSGMHQVALSLVEAEKKLGLDSHLVNMHETNADELDKFSDCPLFVAHTHFPEELKRRVKGKSYKVVFPVHGVLENTFRTSVEDSKKGYGHGDGWMLLQYWLQHADAIVTFWPRHEAILRTLIDKHTRLELVDMGVDKEFWAAGKSGGKYAGSPSVWTAENCHEIKWPLDLFIMWPWIYPEFDNASLHVSYLPLDQHRWFFPLVNRNGASYASHISPLTYSHEDLRNIFKSVDFILSLVRYGDFNRLSLEANAAKGGKTISYVGNPYSDFWVHEGDQRETAKELIAILKGDTSPRADKSDVPDISSSAVQMKAIYESVL